MTDITSDESVSNPLEDEKTVLPEEIFRLLWESVNTLYGKITSELREVTDSDLPVAVKRAVHAAEEPRLGQLGLLMRWIQDGFRIETNEERENRLSVIEVTR